MGKLRLVRIWAMVLLMLSASQALAADHYIRAGATGSNNGSDWNNAYPSLPASLQRGATYYIADGSYPSYTFDDAESGTTTITIRKATVADHGTSTGWVDAYGDGQAILGSIMAFTEGYYIVDGNGTHTIPSDNPANYGFKISSNTSTNWAGILQFGGYQHTVSHIDIRYVHVYNTTNGSINNNTISVRFDPRDSQNHIRLQNCFIENCGSDGLQISRSSYILVERCYLKRLGKLLAESPDYHGQTVQLFYGGDDIIFRWNIWEANEGQGLVQIAAEGNPTSRVRFYGNLVFVKYGHTAETPGFNSSGGIFGCAWVNDAVDAVYVYNNTCVNIGGDYGGTAGFPMRSPSGARYCYNNLMYNCERTGFFGWTAYGYHASGGGDVAGGSNEQAGLAASIFKDYTGNDLRLASATAAGLTLKNQPWWDDADDFFGYLDSDRDMYGDVRGADGTWDRGAFEYGAVPPGLRWESIVPHGPAGDIVTPLADGAVEPRAGGLRTLRATASVGLDPATVVPAAITVVGAASGDLSALVTSATLDASGRVITIGLSTAPPDGDTYTVTVTDAVRTTGGTPLEGDTALVVTGRVGDVDASGEVTPADIVAVRNAAGQAVSAATAHYDVDRSGSITTADMQVVRKSMGSQLP